MSQREFLTLLDDEVGLRFSVADLDTDVDELDGWDSVHLWRVLTALESRTGRRLPFGDLLEIRTLDDLRTSAAQGD